MKIIPDSSGLKSGIHNLAVLQALALMFWMPACAGMTFIRSSGIIPDSSEPGAGMTFASRTTG